MSKHDPDAESHRQALDDIIHGALDELDTRRRCEPGPEPEPVVQLAEVLDDQHPSLQGRVQVHTSASAARWVPVLRGLAVCRGDRVLVSRVVGLDEPVVVGVLDGLAPRSEPRQPTHEIALNADQAVAIVATDGRPLLEIHDSARGPVLRLTTDDLTLDVPGALRVLADQLELRARDGGVAIEAAHDVEIKGEVIHLN